MAPRALVGKLIVGCDNGSVQNRSLEELKGVLDLSKVKGLQGK